MRIFSCPAKDGRLSMVSGFPGTKDAMRPASKFFVVVQVACHESDIYMRPYSIFADDEEACMVSVLFCIYLDANSFANRGEIVKSGVNKVYLKTTNKRLIAKYDPVFKARILRQSV